MRRWLGGARRLEEAVAAVAIGSIALVWGCSPKGSEKGGGADAEPATDTATDRMDAVGGDTMTRTSDADPDDGDGADTAGIERDAVDGGSPPATPGRLIGDQNLVVHESASAGEEIGRAKPYPHVELDNPSYTVLSGSQGVFAIDSATGAITVADPSALDAASKAQYRLEVRLRDDRVGTATVRVRVLASSDVVYIDPSAGSSGDGSRGAPYTGFDDVSWSSGTAYLVRRDTKLVTGSSITVGADDVLLGAYGSGARPVVECTAVPSNGNIHAVNATGRTGVEIRDLTIDAPDTTSALRLQGDDATVDTVELRGPRWGLRAFGSRGLAVLHSEVHQIGEDGLFIQGQTDIEVASSRIHDVNQRWSPPSTPENQAAGDGIQLSKCDEWHVHDNVVDRRDTGNKFCFIANNPNQSEGVLEHNVLLGPRNTKVGGATVYFGSGSGLVVRHNRFGGGAPTAMYFHASAVEIYGNLFADLEGGIASLVDSRTLLLHNTFDDVASPLVRGKRVAAHNNVFSLHSGGDVFDVDDVEASHNLRTSGTAGPSGVVDDPRFVDDTKRDYRLQSGSPAVDVGKSTRVRHDLRGVSIPQGSTPDLGCFERRTSAE